MEVFKKGVGNYLYDLKEENYILENSPLKY